VLKRRAAPLAAIGAGVIICCQALSACSAVSSAPARTAPGQTALGQTALGQTALGQTALGQTAQGRASKTEQARVVARPRDALAACGQRLERTARGIPAMAIVGASYTAGVGPHNPALSWAVRLARLLRWNAVVYGVSGAGYVHDGGGRWTVSRMLASERLAALDPALVIVQAGHDDAGIPAGTERRGVRQAIGLIRAQAPHARIALITVFTGRTPSHSAAFYRTDAAITAAGIAADRQVIIMDPLTGHWTFQHFHGGLHPTAAGDAWIASKVAAILRAHGVLPAPAIAGKAPVICDDPGGFGRRDSGVKAITVAPAASRNRDA
jgi:lysophospholipase L1-like esterase